MLIINFEGCEAKGFSKGRYDETSAVEDGCMKPPEILFDLHSGKKSESNPHILKDDFRKMQSCYKNYQQI